MREFIAAHEGRLLHFALYGGIHALENGYKVEIYDQLTNESFTLIETRTAEEASSLLSEYKDHVKQLIQIAHDLGLE